jgi:hypothetical protein
MRISKPWTWPSAPTSRKRDVVVVDEEGVVAEAAAEGHTTSAE